MSLAYGINDDEKMLLREGEMQPQAIVSTPMKVDAHIVSTRRQIAVGLYSSEEAGWFTYGDVSLDAVRIRRGDPVYTVDVEMGEHTSNVGSLLGGSEQVICSSLAGLAIDLGVLTVKDTALTYGTDPELVLLHFTMRNNKILIRNTYNATSGEYDASDVKFGKDTDDLLNNAIKTWCNMHVRYEGVAQTDFIPGKLSQNTGSVTVAVAGALTIVSSMTTPFGEIATAPEINALLGIEWPHWPPDSLRDGRDVRGQFSGFVDYAGANGETTLVGRPTLKRVDIPRPDLIINKWITENYPGTLPVVGSRAELEKLLTSFLTSPLAYSAAEYVVFRVLQTAPPKNPMRVYMM